MIKKADIVLAIVLIAVGLVSSYALTFGDETGQTVEIFTDGREYASYSLLEDRTVSIEQKNHMNKVTIKGGKVSMTFSNCSGQDCVKQGKISRTAESIVCLPHKVVIEIHGKNRKYDSVSR